MIKYLIFTQASAVASSMDTVRPIGERLGEGLQMLALGLGIVMSVLAFLWGALELFRVFFYEIPKKRKAAAQPKPEETEQTAPEPEAAEPTAEPSDDDGELAAAITAAVYAYLGEQAKDEGKPVYTGGFRVVSFRKV